MIKPQQYHKLSTDWKKDKFYPQSSLDTTKRVPQRTILFFYLYLLWSPPCYVKPMLSLLCTFKGYSTVGTAIQSQAGSSWSKAAKHHLNTNMGECQQWEGAPCLTRVSQGTPTLSLIATHHFGCFNSKNKWPKSESQSQFPNSALWQFPWQVCTLSALQLKKDSWELGC